MLAELLLLTIRLVKPLVVFVLDTILALLNLMSNAMMILIIAWLLQVEARVVVVMVISPAGFFFHLMMALPLTSSVLFSF